MTTSQNQATCTDPLAELLVPLSQGQLGAEESGRVLDHVESCPTCSKELDFLADVVTAATADARTAGSRSQGAPAARPAPPPAEGKLIRFPFGLVTALAAAAAILLLVVPQFLGSDASVASFSTWSRPDYSGVRFGDEFETAMQPYVQGDDQAAEAALSAWIAGGGAQDVMAYYYRAATRIELGRLEEARDDLIAGRELAQGVWLEATQWSLANVHLMLDDADAALSLLDEIAQGTGSKQAAAAELATEVRSATR